MTEARLYYGPHLCRVLACVRAGYLENAASWMERDIGEYGEPADYPVPDSLKVVPLGMSVGGETEGVEYLAVGDVTAGLEGEGI